MASTTTVRTPTPTHDDEVPERRISMTYDEYLAWSEEDESHHGEWVDGQVIVFTPTSDRHQRIHAHLFPLLGVYLTRRQLGRILNQTFEMRSRLGKAREPDIIVLLNEHLDRLESLRLRGAADLAVEIVSPDSVTRDGTVKRGEYAEDGVPEYWIVDPRHRRETVEVLTLGTDGRYGAVEPDELGRLHSAVLPGVWVDPAWLDDDAVLPDAVELGLAMVAAAEGSARPSGG